MVMKRKKKTLLDFIWLECKLAMPDFQEPWVCAQAHVEKCITLNYDSQSSQCS